LSFDSPFWFATPELLADLQRAEIHSIRKLFAKHPGLPEFFDFFEATVPQRTACFALLAHCALVDAISETFAQRWEQSPSLDEKERDILRRTANLFPADAPAWVKEINEAAELLPSRMRDALPEPLRKGRFAENASAQAECVKTLSSVEQIQAFTQRVLDQQLLRLAQRWPAQTDRLRGTEGLVSKTDISQYSQYMDKLTEKQRLAFVLRIQYGLTLPQIASRMRIHRKTADEHIKAAEKKLGQAYSSEKRKVRNAKNNPEF
jgi:DNA-binding CsgD family transcriptional regulator